MDIVGRLALLACVALFGPQDPPSVELGRPLRGEVAATDAAVSTAALGGYTDAVVRGRGYRFTATVDDAYTIDLSSADFDAYLVVRGDDGAVLAEDDDGLVLTDARVVVTLRASQTVTIAACALHGQVGTFELKVRRGQPPQLSARERTEAEINAWKERIAGIEQRSGAESAALIEPLNNLGVRLWQSEQFEEALSAQQRALTICTNALGPDTFRTGFAHVQVAPLLSALKRHADAEREARTGLRILEASTEDHRQREIIIDEALSRLGQALSDQARDEDAMDVLEQLVERRFRRYGERHPATRTALAQIAEVAQRSGQSPRLTRFVADLRERPSAGKDPDPESALNDAQGLLLSKPEDALAIAARVRRTEEPAGETPLLAQALFVEGSALLQLHRDRESEHALRRSVDLYERTEPRQAGTALLGLGTALFRQNKLLDAEAATRRALAVLDENQAVPPDLLIVVRSNLAAALDRLGRRREALEFHRQIVGLYGRLLPHDSVGRFQSLLDLGQAEFMLSNWAQSTAIYREAVGIAEHAPTIEPMLRAFACANLARSMGEQSIWTDSSLRAEAETWFNRSLELYAAIHGAEHPATGALRAEWGAYLARTGRVAIGEREIRAGLEAARRDGRPATIRRIQELLGGVLLDTGRAEAAEPVLREYLESLERETGSDSFELFDALHLLVSCLVELARFDEATDLSNRAQKIAAETGDPTTAVLADQLAVAIARHRAPPGKFESLLRSALNRAALAGIGEESVVVESFEGSLAVVLADEGRNSEAEPILRKLLTRAEARLGDAHPMTACYQINLAHVLTNLHRVQEARDLAQRALHTLERIEGEELRLADAFVCLSGVDRCAGHNAAAAASLRRALTLREAHLPAEHPHVIRIWSELANVLEEPTEAEHYARRAVAVGERILGADSADLAYLLGVLASRLESTEQPAEAAGFLRRALTILESQLGRDSVNTCLCALNLARMLGEAGDADRAQALLDEVLPRVKRGLAATPECWQRCLHDVARALEVTGATVEAEAWVRRSIDTTEAAFGSDSPVLVGLLKTLGNLLLAQGRIGEAEASLRRAIALVESEDGPEAYGLTGLLHDLAMLLDVSSRTDESLELMRRSAAIRQRLLGDAHPGTLESSWLSLAYLLGKAHRLREADDLLADILGRDAVEHLDRLSYARLLNLRSLLRLGLGEPDALEWARRATAAAAEHPGSLMSLAVQANLPLLEALSGNRERARQAALGTLRMQFASAIPRIGRWSSQDRFFAIAQARIVADLLAHSTDLSSPAETAEAFEALSTTRGAAFRADRSAHVASADHRPAIAEVLARLRRLAAEQSALAFARNVDDVDGQAGRLHALADEERRAELELLQMRPAEPGAWTASVERIRAELPAGSALLAFALLIPQELRHVPDGMDPKVIPERALAFVIDVAGIHGVDLGESAPLRDATTAFLREMSGNRDGEAGLRTSRNDRLRRLLWDPLAPLLTDAQTIFVAPDSFLARLPLEVIADEQGRHLVESHSFVYTSDPRSLLDALEAPSATRSRSPDLLVVADVDYAERSASPPFLARAKRSGFAWDWAPLPETAPECDAIVGSHATLGGDVMVLRGPSATEELVKARAGAFTVLHFATHGFFEPTGVPSLAQAVQRRVASEFGALQDPNQLEPTLEGHSPDLLSGLVLAGANRPRPGQDDGYLTAKEVGYLDLSGCELVVLSGCDTGVGTSRGGEAMLGLRRMFHTAGARTVISSLWKVRDHSTRELMASFYRHLWQEHAPPATALRCAQLEMLSRQRAAGETDPGAWGAFVLSGDWK